jgi:tRNA U34 5-carboxymethylaminomethyl modifying enzyme MnmG/GidA
MSDFQELRTTQELRVISSKTHEERESRRWEAMILRPAPRITRYESEITTIPVGSWVTVLHYNLSIQGQYNARIRWEGNEYEVEAKQNSFEDPSTIHRQPIESYKKGKLYRFKHFKGSDLVNNGKRISGVNPNDIVLYLQSAPWRNGRREHGYKFEVIHEDLVGWVGNGVWATLEEMKDE